MTQAVEDKIIKLLAIANDKAANEHEASAALELAQKLADAHNLELSSVSAAKQGRDDRKINKGLYPYQRTLYEQLAALNHCRYWFQKGLSKGSAYEIRLLGSKVNVATVNAMAGYIEEVANRLVKEEMVPAGHHYFSKASHLFREGLIDRVVVRLNERRREEVRQRREANAASGGGNQLVLIEDVAKREEEANYDYLYGEGAYARAEEAKAQRLREYEEMMARKRAEEEAFKRDHPEEWARREAEKQAERDKWAREWDKRQSRARQAPVRSKKTKFDDPNYWRGSDAGGRVNLDRQINGEERKAIK